MDRSQQIEIINALQNRYALLYKDAHDQDPPPRDTIVNKLKNWKALVTVMPKQGQMTFNTNLIKYTALVDEFDKNTHFKVIVPQGVKSSTRKVRPPVPRSAKRINSSYHNEMTPRVSSTRRVSPNSMYTRKRSIAQLLRVKSDLLTLKKEIEEKVATELANPSPVSTAYASMIIEEVKDQLDKLNETIAYYKGQLNNVNVSMQTLKQDVNNFETKYTNAKHDYEKHYGVTLGGRRTRSKRRKRTKN